MLVSHQLRGNKSFISNTYICCFLNLNVQLSKGTISPVIFIPTTDKWLYIIWNPPYISVYVHAYISVYVHPSVCLLASPSFPLYNFSMFWLIFLNPCVWERPFRQECVIESYFSYFSIQKYVVGTRTIFNEYLKHMFKNNYNFTL